ncbi:ArnT family glycosyltransferase [Fodinibius halophilus]|nr:glycosyltransferase family 39 protein [Fodinibius halophilus]
MEFPPFIGLVGNLSYLLFDYSLMGMRLFPTLAGTAILVLCCYMAKEMGGKRWAVILAGLCVLAFLPYYRNHMLFQPVAFNQFFWVLGFFVLLKYLNTNKTYLLYLLGVIGGIGLMNKYTMLIWGFALAIAFVFHNKARIYKRPALYGAALTALVIFLPNILWQSQYDWPILRHLSELQSTQLGEHNVFEFGLDQLKYPFTFAISLIGFIVFFRDKHLQYYRTVGIAIVVIFSLLWIFQSKSYYFFGAYPVLFAAGAVKAEQWLKQININWSYALAAFILLPSLPFIPESIPVLPIEQHISYSDKKVQDGRVELTSDYADMFGWPEQVQLVDSVYRSLSAEDKKNAIIWAENYGEAGAIKILGDQYGLPDPISRHGSFWLWGYQNPDANVWISIGNEKEVLTEVFEEITLVTMISHEYAIDEENGIPLYICRKPKIDIPKWWADYEKHIFD